MSVLIEPRPEAGSPEAGTLEGARGERLRCARSLAFYLPDLAGGGAERMVLTLIGELIGRGARVSLLLSRGGGALAGEVPAGCEIVVFGTRRTAQDLPHLVRALRRLRPDVLLASMHHNNIVAIAAKALARSGTRLVISLHNALSAETGAGAAAGYRIVPACYRLLSPLADGIVAVSRGVADDMAAATGLRRAGITVLHNPVIDSRFHALSAAPVEHPWLGEKTIPVFVAAGRLVAQKDHATLLRAMALLRRAGPARLIILGDGPERAALARLAGDLGLAADVALPGFVANPLPYVRAATAFVLSSRYEGFGNVLVEALGCGTPVISTACPYGPAEILQDGAYGDLVPVGDAVALAAAMGRALHAPRRAQRLRDRAATFSSARITDGYVRFVERVMGGQGRVGPPS